MAGLAGLGVLILAGLVRSAFSKVATVAALTVFLSFPAGRLVGLLVDGMPSGSIIGALVLELAIAVLCLIAFRHQLRPGASGGAGSRGGFGAQAARSARGRSWYRSFGNCVGLSFPRSVRLGCRGGARKQPSVDRQFRSVHVGCLVRGEQQRDGRDLFGGGSSCSGC